MRAVRAGATNFDQSELTDVRMLSVEGGSNQPPTATPTVMREIDDEGSGKKASEPYRTLSSKLCGAVTLPVEEIRKSLFDCAVCNSCVLVL
jgi:hypothetical protein